MIFLVVKLFGCLLIVGASYLAGFQMSRGLHRRKNFLRDFKAFLTSLSTKLRYSNEDIFSLIESCSEVEKIGISLSDNKNQYNNESKNQPDNDGEIRFENEGRNQSNSFYRNWSDNDSESQFLNNKNQPFEEAWRCRIKEIPKSFSLTKADRELLLCFGSELGKSDVDGQLKHIELYKTMFDKQLAEAEDEVKAKSRLYQTMGLFVGITASLMMV